MLNTFCVEELKTNDISSSSSWLSFNIHIVPFNVLSPLLLYSPTHLPPAHRPHHHHVPYHPHLSSLTSNIQSPAPGSFLLLYVNGCPSPEQSSSSTEVSLQNNVRCGVFPASLTSLALTVGGYNALYLTRDTYASGFDVSLGLVDLLRPYIKL